jgi:hypothetical protein
MIDQKGSRPRGTAGFGKACLQERNDATKYSPPAHSPQAENVIDAASRFRRAQGEIRLVRVAVADGRAPIWRSRAFKIHPRDVAPLLRFAEQLEANRC